MYRYVIYIHILNIYFKMLFRGYNLTMNKLKRSLNIVKH